MDYNAWNIVEDFVYLRNVRGTSIDDDFGSWIGHLRERGVLRRHCIVINCKKAPKVGAHVELFDNVGRSRGIAIAPMCRSHNGERENLGGNHPENGRVINDIFAVRKNSNHPAWLMPQQRQELIRIAERMYDYNLNQTIIDNILYTFDRTQFFIIDGRGGSACKRCTF